MIHGGPVAIPRSMDVRIPTDMVDRPRRGLAVWLPWMLAPVFMLLPIGGCGVAAAARRQATLAGRSQRPEPRPAAETVATIGTVVPQVR